MDGCILHNDLNINRNYIQSICVLGAPSSGVFPRTAHFHLRTALTAAVKRHKACSLKTSLQCELIAA